MATERSLEYKDFGDNYNIKDPFKKYATERARTTSRNLDIVGFSELESSRGESAHVIDVGPFYLASVIEGLGTKNKIADGLYEQDPSKSYYDAVAIDTVASIVNDLIVVGARPLQVLPHWSFGENDWFADRKRAEDLVNGWVEGCNRAGAIYAGGETPTNRGVVFPSTAELSGSATGIIDPKERYIDGSKLTDGDHIVIIESSGFQTNGSSMARGVAETLPDKYLTRLPSGRTIGEALLAPSHIYAQLQQEVFSNGIDIHYMVHMTGHGLRKLMRAQQEFSYFVHTVPTPPEEFRFLQEAGPISQQEAYATFNMGMGFAFFVPGRDAPGVQKAADRLGFQSWDAGIVLNGQKQVIIDPLGLTYNKESLDLR